MWWPWRRRLDRFPLDPWQVLQGQFGGHPCIVQLHAGARKYVGHPELPVLMTVEFRFRESDERGFCNAAELEELGELEDRLDAFLRQRNLGYLVGARTCNGARALYFYARLDKAIARAVKEWAETQAGGRSFSTTFERDPE